MQIINREYVGQRALNKDERFLVSWFFEHYTELAVCIKYMGTEEEKEKISKLSRFVQSKFSMKPNQVKEVAVLIQKYKGHMKNV